MHGWQKEITVFLFIFTYWVMAVGRFHLFKWLKLGRASVALFCGVLLVLLGAIGWEQIPAALNLPTLLILLALMLISSVFYCSGFYTYIALKAAQMKITPSRLLFFVISVSAMLSAWFANDIVAFAMTPMLCRGLYRRNMDARPYLFGLMGGCNVGSIATMIGSPQNIIIAQHGNLPFWTFFRVCAPISLFGVFVVYAVVRFVWRKQLLESSRFKGEVLPPVERDSFLIGLVFLLCFVLGLTLPIPRWISALLVSTLILVIFWWHWSEIVRRVDWRLLGLFTGLFLVNQALANTGIPQQIVEWLYTYSLHAENLGVLTGYAFLSVNTVGKAPAAIFLLTLWPNLANHSLYAFVIMSGLAGNTFLFSSLANIIVAERSSTKIHFLTYIKTGVPITILSMSLAFLYLYLL